MRRSVPTHGDDPSRAALCLVERKDGAILSVWNRTYHCWGLPGGKVDHGEALANAAARELQEETGLVAFWVNGPIYRSPTYSGSGRVCYAFEVETIDGDHAVPLIREVGTGVAWMTRDFLMNQPTTGAWFTEFFAYLDDTRPA